MERVRRKLSDIQISSALAARPKAALETPEPACAISATFTAEPVEESLAFWLKQLELGARVEFAPFNQVFQQLLDPASLLAINSGGINVVLVRLEDLQSSAGDSTQQSIENTLRELIAALQNAARRSTAAWLVSVCPPSSRFAAAHSEAFIRRMEALLETEFGETAGVYTLSSRRLLQLYPVRDYEDEYAFSVSGIPYTPAFFTALGTMLARTIYSLRAAPAKVIVLDCDNTLWSGVCGEDGPLGVEVTESHCTLQEFLLAQQRAGMLLALCSKNAEEDVTRVFETNPGMLLRRAHLAASRINWRPKSDNLKELAQELNLGLDSFVLVDDNHIECAEVRANAPEALVLELPADPLRIPGFLNHCWAFDHSKTTREDQNRTALYAGNRERESLRKESLGLEEFLERLELRVSIRPLEPADLARASQLTERTNQFNFTTLRRTEARLLELFRSGAECLAMDVSDRFGDYGLVGLAIFSTTANALQVDTFLLSCRALGRKVEHHLLARLGAIAQERGLEWVEAGYIPTPKNRPALDFLESVGSQFRTEGREGTTYRFPAMYGAALLDLRIDSSPAPATSEPRTVPARTGAPAARSGLLNRIASQLATVEAISYAVESHRPWRLQPREGRVAPRTIVEEILAGIWSSLPKIAPAGVFDDFFALGGNSLLAAQVVARIRQTLGVEIPLRTVFEAPTIAQLAQRIEAAQQSRTGVVIPPLAPAPRNAPLPLSFAQQRLWFLDQLEPLNTGYNVPYAVRLRGPLQVDALERSLGEIVKRHEVLRTRFEAADSEPVQVIDPWRQPELPLIDLSAFPDPEREVEAQRLAHEAGLQPFDLRTGPLQRATLLRLAAEDHVLVLTTHHIVTDGWSFGVFSAELAALYAAFLEGRPSPLADLPVQYADYAVWQRAYLAGVQLDRQLTWWKRQLEGAPPALELPTDRPRPLAQTFRGARRSFTLSEDLKDSLAELSRREGVTLFMTLLASFNVLLSRYSGQDDLVIGSPIAGRNHVELEKLIGLFVNTLVLRTSLAGNPTFRELLVRVRETTLGAYAHQALPFEKLVEELQPERDLSRNPLFQVMFILQNAAVSTRPLAGLEVSNFPQPTRTSNFDLTLLAIERTDGFRMVLEYNTDLFDAATIDRMLGHLRMLLEAVVRDPAQPAAGIPLLTAEERRKLLVDWNSTERDYPREAAVHQLFEAQAARTPGEIAVIAGEEQLSYRELNRRSNQLASYLRRRGAGPGVLVGISLQRTAEMLVGLLAILKSGAAYLPLDPEYPEQRLTSILEDSRAGLLLTLSPLCARLPHPPAHTICLDQEWPEIALEPEANPPGFAAPEALAYVLYTSGSTGRPKGVEISHRNLVNFLASMREQPGIDSTGTLLAVTTLSFDIAGLELYLPLMAGARVVIASEEEARDGRRLIALLERWQPTILQATPATWTMLLDAGWKGSPRLKALCGGETLPPELARQLVPLCAELWNMYGPTETTIWSSIYRVESTPTRSAPIGKPIANTTMYVLDARREPVPVGVAGELYIAGDGVARGYLNRPELTTEKFVPDPFRPGARMYRTGDRATFLPGGNLQYLGRLDDQVKIRGFRIEPGEVGAVLGRHPAVKECAVIVRTDAPGEPRLVAYIVARRDGEPVAAEAAQYLTAQLPAYMLPAALVELESLPRTPNGKVDRKNLPAPEYTRRESAQYAAPRTHVEEQAAAVWSEVLRVSAIGIHDNFFALGGHSLRATQVMSRTARWLGIDLPLRTLFEAPTIAQFAARIEAAQRSQSGLVIPPLERMPREGPLPLSFAQQRLWFLDQLQPLNAGYNVPYAVRLRGPLRADALERSLGEIVRRHEVLRTRFETVYGDPVQVVEPWRQPSLPVTDLSAAPEPDRERQARRIVEEETSRSFDLQTGPLQRASLIRLASDDHILLVNTHHIVIDGWSLDLFTGELAALYHAFAEGRPSPLEELPLQFADYAAWQNGYLAGEQLERQLSWWKHKLEGAPPALELPADRPRPPVQTFHGAQRSLTLPAELQDQLAALSRKEGVTLFMTLLAVFNVLLSRYSGHDDIVVGSPIAGRNHVDLEKLIGLFVNTLVLRTDLAGNPSFRDLLARVRETTLGAYAHQNLPFEKLVEELQPERDLSRNPLFQVVFMLQNLAAPGTQNRTGLVASPFAVENQTSKFDLTLMAVERAEGLRLVLEYNTDLFDAATIDRMLGHLRTLAEEVVRDPEQQTAAIPLLTASERRQLLVEWNSTERDYPRDACVHRLFELQAQRTPDAIALVYRDQSVTYAELDARSTRLAGHLRSLGVGPDVLVGICAERSPEMIAGLLGILKAGGAYVPLDYDYPAQRLALMIEDAGIGIVLARDSVRKRLPAGSYTIVPLERPEEWAPTADANTAAPTADSLAYVIYTSGSTGEPKGVATPHRGIVRLLFGTDYVRFGECEVFLQLAPLAFDASTVEIWGALLHGGKLVLFPPGVPDTTELGEAIARHGVSTLWLTASLFNFVIDESPGILAPVRQLLTGGEALSVKHVRRALDALPDTQLINGYGPTESTTFAACYSIPRPLASDTPSIPLGRPIANTTIYILDRNLQPVPVGVTGELHIGGDGLAREYFRRPELTAAKFIRNPFSDDSAARLYASGDLARFLANGNIEFLGRVDDQAKIRGFRVEPGEVEAVLEKHPAVKECAVIVRTDPPGEARLTAYVVPRRPGALLATEVTQYLQTELPPYLMPSSLVEIPALPRTANGKVDRKSLLAPEYARPEKEAGYVAPRTPLEEKLVSIWSSVLGVPRIGVHDNFFDLGGHSLLAVKLFGRMERELGEKVPLHTLFSSPTIAGVALRIQAKDWSTTHKSISPLRTTGSKPPIFAVHGIGGTVLTFRLLANHLDPDQPIYCLETLDINGSWTRLEELAAHYVRVIRGFQPHGPYHLVGSSFGGMVVFEMATQLLADGQEVGLVGLLDSYNMGRRNLRTRRQRIVRQVNFIKNRIRTHAGRLFTRLPSEWPRYSVGRVLAAGRLLYGYFWRVAYRSYNTPGRAVPGPLHNLKRAYEVAALDYVPKVYPGKAVLFRAMGVEGGSNDQRGWSGLAQGGLEVIDVPGDHNSLLSEPNVAILAQEMDRCLARYAEPREQLLEDLAHAVKSKY